MSLAPVTPARFGALPGAHWLHPQKSSRVPRRFVFIDTEAHRAQELDQELQTWRLGVSACRKWREASGTWSPIETVRHETPEDLWDTVASFARQDARTVVVAHNMAYDLRISRGLEILPAMGWRVTKLALTARHVSVDLERDRYSLCLVDSATVLAKPLATVAAWSPYAKPELPAEEAGEAEWWERCEADVKVLAWAYTEVVDWLRRDDLGGWARTGAGIGWHTMLRHHLAEPVLVHGIEALHDLEGRSAMAGRCEVWRHGPQTAGPYVDWDFELAYAGVMASESLPTVYRDQVTGVGLDRMVRATASAAFLVHASVETETPVLPWRDDKGVCWPVGRFSGWWWHWELAEAEEAGARLRVREAHRYSAAPWLADWAAWVIETVADQSSPEAKVRSAVAKHWQRSLVGRSAMRYHDWHPAGPAWRPGLSYWPLVDRDTGARGAAVMLGDKRWEAWAERWWDSALPQLLSAVMAHTRVRLWRAMSEAGWDNLVYLDSDCVVTCSAGSERLREATRAGRLPGLRAKSHHDALDPIAPQLIEGSTYRKLAGIPRGATSDGALSYTAERWDGLLSTLASGRPDAVRVVTVHPTIRPIDWRRAHLPDGTTRPYVVDGDVREMPAEAS